MKSENKNFVLNVVYQLLTYIFPLITVPYTSRVLGAENTGIYSYTYSVVYMFMLAAMLGINNYGNREIAKTRDDKGALSKAFCSIYSLQLIVGSLVTVAYVIYAWKICREYTFIAQLQIVFLISSCVDVNWFYFGLEKFKMTITRNLIIKLLSVALIFLLVKTRTDLWKYTLIMGGATLLSQMYLFLSLPKYITIEKVHLRESLAHLKSVLILFVPVLAFGIYRVMDKTMLGALSTVTELGYYENAERLINIPIAVINALGTVMLPRMSYLIAKDKTDFRQTITNSMKLAMTLSTIMSLGLVLIAHDAAIVLFGSEFEKSGGIIMALSATVIASAWANVIRTQYLIPNRMDSVYVASTSGGAIVNFIFNSLLIGRYGAYGACVGTVLAEYFVAIYQSIRTRKQLPYNKFLKTLLVAFAKAFAVIVPSYFIAIHIHSISVRLVVKIGIAALLFLLLNKNYIKEFLGVKMKS